MSGPVRSTDAEARRPVPARRLSSIRSIAALLGRAGVSPNAVSVFGVLCSLLAGGLLWWTASHDAGSALERVAWLAAAALVGLRLLANVLDGLIAVEGGRRTPMGGVFNEFPDRVSDALTLIGLGYASGGSPELGYTAAIVAILAAYVRELGHGLGARHHFVGPMAKPARMALVIAAAVWLGTTPSGWRPEVAGAGIGVPGWGMSGWSMDGWGVPAGVLGVIAVLGAVTIARRLRLIGQDLRSNERERGPTP